MFQIGNLEYNIKKKNYSLISLPISPEKPISEAVKLTMLDTSFPNCKFYFETWFFKKLLATNTDVYIRVIDSLNSFLRKTNVKYISLKNQNLPLLFFQVKKEMEAANSTHNSTEQVFSLKTTVCTSVYSRSAL